MTIDCQSPLLSSTRRRKQADLQPGFVLLGKDGVIMGETNGPVNKEIRGWCRPSPDMSVLIGRANCGSYDLA